MATSKKFSELPAASSVGNGDLFAIAHEDALAETGYVSQKLTAAQAGQKVNGDTEYPTSLPSFPANGQNPFAALEKLNQDIIDLYPVNTASGSIANFTTSLEMPLVALSSTIVAQQASGTPTPSNPLPISGYTEANITRCGVNLFDGSKVTTTTPSNWDVSFENDNLIIEHRTSYSTGVPSIDFNIFGTFTISFTATQNYKCSLYENGSYKMILNSGTQFTATRGNTYSIIFGANDNTTNIFSNVQIETSNTATEYHAYNATPYLVQFGQTVYGGVLDVTRGKLIVTSTAHVFDGSESFNTINDNKYLYNFGQKVQSSYDNFSSTKCSHFKVGGYAGWSQVLPNEYIIADTYYIGVNPNMTLSDYKAWLADQANNGTPLVATAALQTPIEITGLTPANFTTIAGEQNIFADSGDVSVSFKQGIQEYIDAKIAETQALIL